MPNPIVIDLTGEEGFELRKKALDLATRAHAIGMESGSPEEQSYGILAEVAIRAKLNLPEKDITHMDTGYDIQLSNGVLIDIKCRGGTKPFEQEYIGSGNIPRESKHNFFARQVFDERLNCDIYLMTHLLVPKSKTALPGKIRQRKWKLYICGWVSKERVKRDGVYLPKGSLSEKGQGWMEYRSAEIEFYNKNLNGLDRLEDILTITKTNVEADTIKEPDLNLTKVDAMRIALDLEARGVFTKDDLKEASELFGIEATKIPTILHPNQYYHLLNWLKLKGKIDDDTIDKLSEIMKEVKYEPS
ncbi:MAG: hypothetical protein QXL94_06495 [Candidatus Parvarchaeum sp.]